MIILGIESTCDETAAALVEDGRHLLSNVISTSVKNRLFTAALCRRSPAAATANLSALRSKALLDAGKTSTMWMPWPSTFAPGLIGAVLVGDEFCQGSGLLGQ